MARVDDPSPQEVMEQGETDARADAATAFSKDSTWDTGEFEERMTDQGEKPWQLRRRERHTRWT